MKVPRRTSTFMAGNILRKRHHKEYYLKSSVATISHFSTRTGVGLSDLTGKQKEHRKVHDGQGTRTLDLKTIKYQRKSVTGTGFEPRTSRIGTNFVLKHFVNMS